MDENEVEIPTLATGYKKFSFEYTAVTIYSPPKVESFYDILEYESESFTQKHVMDKKFEVKKPSAQNFIGNTIKKNHPKHCDAYREKMRNSLSLYDRRYIGLRPEKKKVL
jgi:hypothetical protein